PRPFVIAALILITVGGVSWVRSHYERNRAEYAPAKVGFGAIFALAHTRTDGRVAPKAAIREMANLEARNRLKGGLRGIGHRAVAGLFRISQRWWHRKKPSTGRTPVSPLAHWVIWVGCVVSTKTAPRLPPRSR